MTAKKSNKIIICLFLALAFVLSIFVGGAKMFSSDAATTLSMEKSREVFKISVLKNSSSANSTTMEYNGGTANVYAIGDVDTFKLEYDFSNLGIDPGLSTSNNKYNLSIDIQFLKAYSDSTFTNGSILNKAVEIYSNAFSTSYSSLSSFNGYSRSFNIHDGLTNVQNGEEIFFGGWGIYRFKMTLNNVEAYSDFFIIEPTKQVSGAPVVVVQQTSFDKYQFSLKQPHGYNYIDPDTLVWYVYGKTNDGSTFVLTEGDLDSREEFYNIDFALYSNNFKRTGLTFEFKRPEFSGKNIAGTWTVWCEYKYKDSTYAVPSNRVDLKLGEEPKQFPYIWVIGGACGLAVVGTIIIAAVKAKREKIY
ncbi:MAG: hypothetical protein J6K97_02545 [Clostridia bacterium]|nr:hypothetical protein [Clostridia bacterium]